ncbi:hypothetical protein DPSP01_004684 [Paraphaeosphaeria sporulosa]
MKCQPSEQIVYESVEEDMGALLYLQKIPETRKASGPRARKVRDNDELEGRPQNRHRRSRAPSPEEELSEHQQHYHLRSSVSMPAKYALRQFDRHVLVRTFIELKEEIRADGDFIWWLQGDDNVYFHIVQTFAPEEVRAVVRTMTTYINHAAMQSDVLPWPAFKADITKRIVAASNSRDNVLLTFQSTISTILKHHIISLGYMQISAVGSG